MKLNLLAFAAHPDDIELSCGATLAKCASQGYSTGIVDFTQGQMGTRGTPEKRLEEANDAGKILGLKFRENLGFEDIFFKNDDLHQRAVVKMIRKYQPEVVLANSLNDRHPDHPRSAAIVTQACFLSGLQKYNTSIDEKSQKPWRPRAVYHYIQSTPQEPDFVMDVSDHWQVKLDAIAAFKSQFYDPNSNEPETYISDPRFIEMLEGRGKVLGHSIGVSYGEGFVAGRVTGVANIFDLI